MSIDLDYERRLNMPKVEKRVVIGFETTKEFKDRAIKAGKAYKSGNIFCPLTLSSFCRVAVEALILKREIEEED